MGSKAIHELTIFQEGKPDFKLAARLDSLDRFGANRGIVPLTAHPTAWVVATVKSEEADKEVREMIFTDGAELAVICWLVIYEGGPYVPGFRQEEMNSSWEVRGQTGRS